MDAIDKLHGLEKVEGLDNITEQDFAFINLSMEERPERVGLPFSYGSMGFGTSQHDLKRPYETLLTMVKTPGYKTRVLVKGLVDVEVAGNGTGPTSANFPQMAAVYREKDALKVGLFEKNTKGVLETTRSIDIPLAGDPNDNRINQASRGDAAIFEVYVKGKLLANIQVPKEPLAHYITP